VNRNRQEKAFYFLVIFGMLLSCAPLIASFDLEVVILQIVFCLYIFSPLGFLLSSFRRARENYISNSSKMNGIIGAASAFIMVNMLFSIAVFYEIMRGGVGSSTSGIAYIFIPIISSIIMVIGYWIGYFVTGQS